MAELRRIGFLADTHSRKADGSDLPQQALDAFAGVDLIVHLGDIGQKGILDRLAEVAPVLVPVGGDKGYVPHKGDAAPVKVLESNGISLGLTFNIANPDKAILVDAEGMHFDRPVDALVAKRFGRVLNAVAFAGTHVALSAPHDDVLFFNPGSPTLPSDKQGDDDLGSVAVLEFAAEGPKVELVRLKKA